VAARGFSGKKERKFEERNFSCGPLGFLRKEEQGMFAF
jgi:hypothetical protein